MNGIQGTNPGGRQWNRILDAVVTIIKYKKSTIDHAIYIKFFTDGIVSYLTISTDNDLNTTNNETEFLELKIGFNSFNFISELKTIFSSRNSVLLLVVLRTLSVDFLR